MGCPRSATSCSAGAAAGESESGRSAGGSLTPPVDRGGPRALARRPDLALAGADGASAMRRRPRAGGGGAEPVPLEGGLDERPGLAEAVVGRLVEPSVERGRPSARPTAKPGYRPDSCRITL